MNLAATLGSGQAFRWRPLSPADWVGVVRGQVVRVWVQEEVVRCRAFPGPADFLPAYFRAEFDLASWADRARQRDPRLASALARYPGLRLLRQEPMEAFLCFAGATARSVEIITRSVDLLAQRHGRPIAGIDGQTFHAFPAAGTLARLPREELFQGCRLFYRASTVLAAARFLAQRGAGWPEDLARRSYREARAELAALPGFGLKVADCICLFALGFDQAVPVDAQIWKVASLLFPDQIPTRSLTPRTYDRIGDLFRARFGPEAGWAQQYLYHASRQKAEGQTPEVSPC